MAPPSSSRRDHQFHLRSGFSRWFSSFSKEFGADTAVPKAIPFCSCEFGRYRAGQWSPPLLTWRSPPPYRSLVPNPATFRERSGLMRGGWGLDVDQPFPRSEGSCAHAAWALDKSLSGVWQRPLSTQSQGLPGVEHPGPQARSVSRTRVQDAALLQAPLGLDRLLAQVLPPSVLQQHLPHHLGHWPCASHTCTRAAPAASPGPPAAGAGRWGSSRPWPCTAGSSLHLGLKFPGLGRDPVWQLLQPISPFTFCLLSFLRCALQACPSYWLISTSVKSSPAGPAAQGASWRPWRLSPSSPAPSAPSTSGPTPAASASSSIFSPKRWEAASWRCPGCVPPLSSHAGAVTGRPPQMKSRALRPGHPQGPQWSWRPPPPLSLPLTSCPEASPQGPAPGISNVLSSPSVLGAQQFLKLEFCFLSCASGTQDWAGSRSSCPGSEARLPWRTE